MLPPGSPLPSVAQILRLIADPTGFLDDCARRYGDTFTLRVLGKEPPVVFFSDPDSIEAIFTKLSDRLELGKVTHVFRPLVGNQSLIMQDGSRHHQQRQMLMPAMHGDRLVQCGQLICDITKDVIDRWQPGEINLQASMLDISLEIIVRVVFGIEPGDRAQQLKLLLHRLMEDINSPLYSVQFFLPPLQQNLGAWSPWGKFVRLRQQIDELIYAEIADRRLQECDRSDILSMLLTARDAAGEPLSDVELRDQLMTLLLLGHETTASGLAWIFYWLCQNSEVRDRLLVELDTPQTPAAQVQQPYLTAVCKEALRVYPIALISQPRVVKQSIELAGYTFDPGAVLVPCIYLAHRRAETYANSTQFQPDRFLTGKLSAYEYLPFGGGARSCIGAALAMFEMKLVLATVLRSVELEAIEPLPPARPTRRGITFVPPSRFRLTMKQRSRSAPGTVSQACGTVSQSAAGTVSLLSAPADR